MMKGNILASRLLAPRRQVHTLAIKITSNNRTGKSNYYPRSVSASTTATQLPLFLWLGERSSNSKDIHLGSSSQQQKRTSKTPLLLPVVAPAVATITTVSDLLNAVHNHYSADQYFVGGMGESDPGVYIAVASNDQVNGVDTLDHMALILEGIDLAKQERHGVPFHICTSGLVPLDLAAGNELEDIGFDTLQVSLFAATPRDYVQVTGGQQAQFGQVCGFIANATEQGIAVEVSVMNKYANEARELALSLGARNVHVY